MPSSLFWAMESCIVRVWAEKDLRDIGGRQAVSSEEALTQQKRNLTLQLGQVYKVKRSRIVSAEPGALDKLRSMM